MDTMCNGNCACDTPEVLKYDRAEECTCIFNGDPELCICINTEPTA